MEKWYLIYAYEHRYEGYYDISDWLVLWTTPMAAKEEAERLSRKVIVENGVDVFFHDELLDWEDGVEWAMAYQVWELDAEAPIPQIVTMDNVQDAINNYGKRLVWER